MDPIIMKFLEEDEDETMHSGADLDAFTAELNRDIEGNASTSQQPPDSDGGLSQDGSQTTSQFMPHWQTSSHDGIANFQSGQDLLSTEEKGQHASQLELQQHGSNSENRKEDVNTLSHSPSMDACAQPQDDRNTFPASQPMGTQTSREQPAHIQEPDHGQNPERESQMHKLQNIGNSPSIVMGSKDQQSLSTRKGNLQATSIGINNEQVMSTVNQHATGMGMSSQQVSALGMTNQQPSTILKMNKQVPFGMLLPIIQPLLDKDRAMQLHTLYLKLKKNEIPKEGFVRHMRNIVGDHMLKMAVYKLQTQTVRNSQLQTSAQQMQVTSSAQMPTNSSNSTSDSNIAKSESQIDSQGVQTSQMPTSNSSALSQERKHPTFPTQGLDKQQHMHFSHTSFPTYGSAGSSYSSFPATNAASSTSLRPPSHDPQTRKAPAHQNMNVNHMGPTTQAMNMMNMSKFDRPHSLTDPKKIQTGSLTHLSSGNIGLQQNQGQWPSSGSKDSRIGVSSSMAHVKLEPVDQSNEQHKTQLSSSHGLSSLSPAANKQGGGNMKDESFEIQSSRTGFMPPTTLPTNSISSSIPSPMETNVVSSSRISSITSPIGPGNNSKAPPKKPLVGQKKPTETPGSSPPSSKKQKVSGAFLDQSIEHLNDVTAVSGVNLREEEEQLFSGPKEDSRVSEASRLVVQEEEERLILQKIPLQKKVVEIMAKYGLKNMSNDVERCLSLCVEERLRGLICNAIRLSKQRVDMEKTRHKIIVTSDVRQEITAINRKARKEWEKKQAETEKSQKDNEPESTSGADADKEKDESRAKSTKANKEEDDKMRTTAANVAVRAATGVSDMLSRWQLMIEAKQKQGGPDTSSSTQPAKDLARKPSATTTRNTKENQEAEKRDSSAAAGSFRKVGRQQVVPRVARSISVKDVIGVLEREPQMSKSLLLYRLCNRVTTDAAGD